MTRPKATAALLLAMAGFVVHVGEVAAEWGSKSGAACQSSGQTTQSADLTPHAHIVDARAAVKCPVGKADGPIDPQAFNKTRTGPRWRAGSPPPAYAPPPANTACHFEEAFITGVSLDPPGPNRMAHWTSPDPSLPNSAPVKDGSSLPPPPYGQIIAENMSRVAGQFRFTIHYVYDGTYNGVDWECRGSYKYAPGSPCWDDGRYGPIQWCVNVDPAGTIAPVLANPPSPMSIPAIANKLADLRNRTDAGKVGTSPADPTRQFVNLPSCFWVNGVQPQTTFEVTIDGPPNSEGRGLTYVYRVTVGLQRVHWDYGDGATWDGDAGSPYDSSGTCTNPHTYSKVSAIGNPGAVPCPAGYPHPSSDDGCYHVQASETYSVSAVAYWNDNSGDFAPHQLSPEAPFTIPAVDTNVRVLQIEGIPVAH